ncbi:hypothetical protein NMG60_11024718, partial [Bertholletia excelsa]
ILQHPDFESPPTNITSNAILFLLLTKANTIPGPNVSLPGNGHAVHLGKDGKINQTFRPSGNYMEYVLTFTFSPSSNECSNNYTTLNVSAPRRSKETHALYLGSWDGIINLESQKASINVSTSLTCDPIVDMFLIKGIGAPIGYGGGAAFLKNSSEGILLDEEPDPLQTPQQQWAIIGTAKYIDSKHYSVPKGKAAVELVSGAPSGLLVTAAFTKDTTHKLEFMLGDANNSCVGDLTMYAQAATQIQNFTLRSNSTGSAQKQLMTFKADSRLTPISIVRFNESQTSDSVLCGPVIDNIFLCSSYGMQQKLHPFSSFF